MADTTLTTIADLLYNLRGPMQKLYPTRNFLMAAWSGAGQDGAPGRITPLENRDAFNGDEVRVPLDLGLMEAGGWVAEGGTVNVPIPPTFTKATITLKKFIQPFGISLEAMEDSVGSNAVVDATAMNLRKAREAMADKVNVAMCSGGDGVLATVASGADLTWVLDTDTDWDKLYVGQVVDFLRQSDGVNLGNGLRRKIASITISTRTVVFDTAAQASDGDSGNITGSNLCALFVPGSFGNVLAGGIEAAGRGATFQSVTLATYPQFAAVDGRGGDSTTLPFSDNMVDTGVILGQRAGDGSWDFAVGDPNSINVYKNSKQSQIRYQVATGKVAGRFTGIQIDAGNQLLTVVPERKSKRGSIKFLRRDAATLYGRRAGPDYDDQTGSIFKQFNRTTDYEVWLLDRIEWGWHNPSSITYFDDLATQSSVG
jgi:hypothetical protein